MKRFEFRFDNVLDFRQQQLRQAERDLMMSGSRMDTLRRELEALRLSVVDAVSQTKPADPSQDASARLRDSRMMALRSSLAQVEKDLQRAIVKHRDVQKAYRARFAQVEALNTLRKHEWTEYSRRLAVEEQARLDDDVVRRWNSMQASLEE